MALLVRSVFFGILALSLVAVGQPSTAQTQEKGKAQGKGGGKGEDDYNICKVMPDACKPPSTGG